MASVYNVNVKVLNKKLMNIFRPFAIGLLNLGFDPRKILSYKFFFKYRKDRSEWLNQGGKITGSYMILNDYKDNAGNAKGHYFHQDLLIAKLINEHSPKRHVDVASRIDGFVAHVASFREIEVLDVRPLEKSVHKNIKFIQADLMSPQNLGEIDSLSCLHAIEHFGLGRYTDPIDVEGHNKGIANLVDLVSPGGRLYISFPIGKNEEVYFNAHRVFKPLTIFDHPSINKCMNLIRFDYVDDKGDLHLNMDMAEVNSNINASEMNTETITGCGIYTFEKHTA